MKLILKNNPNERIFQIKQFENINTNQKITYSEALKKPNNSQIRLSNNKIIGFADALSCGYIKP